MQKILRCDDVFRFFAFCVVGRDNGFLQKAEIGAASYSEGSDTYMKSGRGGVTKKAGNSSDKLHECGTLVIRINAKILRTTDKCRPKINGSYRRIGMLVLRSLYHPSYLSFIGVFNSNGSGTCLSTRGMNYIDSFHVRVSILMMQHRNYH